MRNTKFSNNKKLSAIVKDIVEMSTAVCRQSPFTLNQKTAAIEGRNGSHCVNTFLDKMSPVDQLCILDRD